MRKLRLPDQALGETLDLEKPADRTRRLTEHYIDALDFFVTGGQAALWRQTGRKLMEARKLLKLLKGKTIKTSIEPFAGSAAWTTEVAKQGLTEKAILADVNRDVINIFREVKEKPLEIASRVEKILKEQDVVAKAVGVKAAYQPIYEEIKAGVPNPQDRVAKMLALGNRSWSYEPGKYVRGYAREVGGSPEFVGKMIEEGGMGLRSVRADIKISNFPKMVEKARKGDFLFIDSPYMGGQQRYYGGGQKGWTLENELKLAELVEEAANRGASGVLYNYKDVVPLHKYVDYWEPVEKSLKGQTIGYFGDIWK